MAMSDDAEPESTRPSLRDRLDAARAAAEEVVAEESGQLGGEVSALALPFEEIAAAVGAAIHPDRLAEREVQSSRATGQAADGEATADGAAPAPHVAETDPAP